MFEDERYNKLAEKIDEVAVQVATIVNTKDLIKDSDVRLQSQGLAKKILS